MITSNKLITSPKIKHAFFTREGGISNGLYSSLNCGFGTKDLLSNVTENRNRVLSNLGIENGFLLTCHQTHSPNVLTIEKPWPYKNSPRADGMVTNVPGLVLGILTADCAPVLFADSSLGIIGAAHAGWQGALMGVLEATINQMVNLGSCYDDIQVVVGPCISVSSYEVGPEFLERFLNSSLENDKYFKPSIKKNRKMFDLPSYIKGRLKNAGITEVHKIGYDTCTDISRFYSYRRSVLLGETDYGRGISTIALVA
jgi:YfiH family protein